MVNVNSNWRCNERSLQKRLITTRDGNCSVRMRGRDYLYITPSGWRKTIIHPEHVVKIKIQDEELLLKDGTNPSGETVDALEPFKR